MQLPDARSSLKGLFAALLLVADASQALQLDINSEQSIKDAASQVTWNMMTYYHGNESGHIPGAFPAKWWEGSALFMALLNYWHFTGDSTYNGELSQGLEWQAGNDNYMPSNYSQYLGNDDQVFWGLAAMTATEFKLPDIPGKYSWLSLAQGVFNSQIRRWDASRCNGGMRWQIYPFEAGYNIKNSVSNGGLFQLSARLARYTYNDQYANWARKIWYWSVSSSPLVDKTTWNVGDSTPLNCASLGNIQWTYNYGIYLMGAAYMCNYTNGTEQAMWQGIVDGLLQKTLETFFLPEHNHVMEDWECEPKENCNDNEILFKGLLSTWLGYTTLLVPSTYETIMPKLQVSAQAAAASCTGYNNNTCGVRWYQYKWDGWMGMEEEISVSNVLSVNLIPFVNRVAKVPLTSTTGGNSTSNPNAGMTSPTNVQEPPVTTGDKVGAGIVTALFVGSWIALIAWMIGGN